MSNVLIEESTMTSIGNAIRSKTGKTDLILPADMPNAINEIQVGGSGDTKKLLFYLGYCGGADTLLFSSSTIVEMAIYLPENAVNIKGYYKFRYLAVNSSNATLGYTNYIEKNITSNADYAVEETSIPGYKKIVFGNYNVSYPSAYALKINGHSEKLSYELPGAYIEDDILCLEKEVTGIYSPYIYAYHCLCPFCLKGIDMRKSSITILNDYIGDNDGYSNLEVVYLPSGLIEIKRGECLTNSNLKEIHFTSNMPPVVNYSSILTDVPTTCKIYVPKGTLEVYKSAENYPSSSTYTYIEET